MSARSYLRVFSSHKESYFSVIRQRKSNFSTMVKKQELDHFKDVLPEILYKLSISEKFAAIPDIMECLKQIIHQNVEGGKKKRGLTTVNAYKILEEPENITKETMHLARVAGWCTEMIHSHFIISDDILDNSTTRRGVPCWHMQPEVGRRAVIDADFIKLSCNEIIKIYFKDKSYYPKLLELKNNALYNTLIGQFMDYKITTDRDYNQFTTDRYNEIAKYKTAYYTFNFPVAISLLLTNNTDTNLLKLVEDMCIQIGRYYQIQDDYLDVYGDPKKTGKESTDIVEAKCSWLAVTALQCCTSSQRIVFKACYGSKEPAHYERIKQLYEILSLRQMYKEYEKAEYINIKQNIGKMPTKISQVFTELMESIYLRQC